MKESDRLLAEGIPLDLANGRAVKVRYSLRSLKVFEDVYGSVGVVQELLAGLFTGENKKTVSTVVPVLAIGLAHEGIAEDELYDLLDIGEIPTYLNAIASALEQAFPPPSTGGKAEGEAPSPGATSTTPPPGASDATTNSSGP